MLDIGYTYYLIFLLILTGVMMMIVDVKAYNKAKMKREKKYAKILGWVNIILGVMIYIANLTYETWFW
ncbi:CLC_0170 family protein [Lederbergia graminis]|uniref:CLC_0170 family protein n=1 Tax=Lederbergia graminis TaxID=735518 RepID=A0ABW0LGR0_9BACI|nr:CLC_0170 family protein [Paenibacillus bovis]HLU22374.1 CLC_0170 family protein [Bacillaceae bacterium]